MTRLRARHASPAADPPDTGDLRTPDAELHVINFPPGLARTCTFRVLMKSQIYSGNPPGMGRHDSGTSRERDHGTDAKHHALPEQFGLTRTQS